MAPPPEVKRHSWLPSDVSLYAALHMAIAAFTIATLVTRPQMWAEGSVWPYLLGIALFTILARWTVRQGEMKPRRALLALSALGASTVAASSNATGRRRGRSCRGVQPRVPGLRSGGRSGARA